MASVSPALRATGPAQGSPFDGGNFQQGWGASSDSAPGPPHSLCFLFPRPLTTFWQRWRTWSVTTVTVTGETSECPRVLEPPSRTLARSWPPAMPGSPPGGSLPPLIAPWPCVFPWGLCTGQTGQLWGTAWGPRCPTGAWKGAPRSGQASEEQREAGVWQAGPVLLSAPGPRHRPCSLGLRGPVHPSGSRAFPSP